MRFKNCPMVISAKLLCINIKQLQKLNELGQYGRRNNLLINGLEELNEAVETKLKVTMTLEQELLIMIATVEQIWKQRPIPTFAKADVQQLVEHVAYMASIGYGYSRRVFFPSSLQSP